MKRILSRGISAEILTLDDFPEAPPLPEEGEDYRSNAAAKALGAARWTGEIALADDSGIEVEALGGKPGLFSARYGTDDVDRRRRLLKALAQVPEGKRGARFVCAVAVASPDGKVEMAEASCEGRIALDERGSGGFGYDPLFLVPEYGKTFAELPPAEKDKISHRGRALAQAMEILRGRFFR